MTLRQRWTLAAAVLGSGVVFLDSTIVTVALPALGDDLSSSRFGVLESQSYVYNGYLLALAAVLILAGALADFHGRKKAFVAGLAGFGITSVACGLAFSMDSLILFRILQGVAGAFIVPGSLAIITASFDEDGQGRAFGIWAGSTAVATIVGPFLGGVLVDALSWRAAFFVNIPILAVALWAVVGHVEESRDPAASGRFDWVGAAVIAIAIGGLGFGGIRGQESQWQDPAAFIGLGLGVAGVIVAPVWMTKAANPLVPPSLFRSRNFTVVNIATVLIYGALYTVFYFVPVYLQGVLGYNAAAAGVVFASAMVFIAVFSPWFGKLASRYGPRRFLAGGSALMGVALLWYLRIDVASEAWVAELGSPSSLVPPDDTLADVFPAMIVFGVGAMMMVAPLTAALMSSVPKQHSGVASAVNNALSRVGPQLASAVIFIVASSIFFSTLGDLAPDLDTSADAVREQFSPLNAPDEGTPPDHVAASAEASTDAFSFAMLVAALLLFAGAAVSGLGLVRVEEPEIGGASARVAAPATNCPPLDVDCLPEGAGTAAT
jgi:EmrB/QacA subfamily drug resistance transporter